METPFISPKDMTTLEHYAASMFTALISLQSIQQFQAYALKKGLLDDDETETSKTIIWEIQRLAKLYENQIDKVLSRSPLEEQEILKSLQIMALKGAKKAVKNAKRTAESTK